MENPAAVRASACAMAAADQATTEVPSPRPMPSAVDHTPDAKAPAHRQKLNHETMSP
jgi:hypothetical protein